MAYRLLHLETEHQQSINNIWFRVLDNQGFTQINELITILLSAFVGQNTTDNRKNTDSKIINIADCKRWKKRLFVFKYLIFIIYYSQLQHLEHYINVQIDPLGNLLTISLIQMGWELSIEPCPN
jgi:hypothetical protein